jgi:hypothetical protein
MFGEGYYSFTFPELVGTIVTIVGIWLIVKQLREAKLASQMEGLLTLGEMDAGNGDSWNTALDLINRQDWIELEPQQAHDLFHETDAQAKALDKITIFFELISVLVRRKALDSKMAYDMYGNAVTRWWERMSKVIRHHRIYLNDKSYGRNWERLALEFEKVDG